MPIERPIAHRAATRPRNVKLRAMKRAASSTSLHARVVQTVRQPNAQSVSRFLHLR
jgi:hypothetical protein